MVKRKRSEPLGMTIPDFKAAVAKHGNDTLQKEQYHVIGKPSSDKAADRQCDRQPINKQSKNGIKNKRDWYQ